MNKKQIVELLWPCMVRGEDWLPPRSDQVMWLIDWAGWSNEDVARITGCSVRTVQRWTENTIGDQIKAGSVIGYAEWRLLLINAGLVLK